MSPYIPHARFPYDESPWIPHFHDADDENQRAQIGAAGHADESGHDALARHILAARPGENPYANYHGPFFEGPTARFVPYLPSQTMNEYFGNYAPPGGVPGMGPFADPRHYTVPGAAGPLVTGDAYVRQYQQQGGTSFNPPGSMY